jgi:hypothetical protein
MRSLSLFALILAGVTLAAAQQPQYKKPKAKPYHSESKRSGEKQSGAPGRVVSDKKLTPHVSNSQELHRVEHQSARSAALKKTGKHPALPRVAKTEHDKNLPIRVSSGKEPRGGLNKQGKNPYKGRLKEKGSNKR